MQISPLVYNEKGHRIASDDDVLDPKHVKVSQDKANVLTNDDAGLAVKAEDLVSTEGGNLLSVGADGKLKASASDAATFISAEEDNTLKAGADGKLYVPPVTSSFEIVSKEEGNMLRYGNDQGAFLDGNDVLSNAGKNLLKISNIDGLIELTEETLKAAGFMPGQNVVAGVKPSDPMLSLDGGGLLSTSFDVEYDEVTGQTTFKGVDGRTVASVTLPVAVKTIKSVTLETDPLAAGKGQFIHFVFDTTDDAQKDIYLDVSKLLNVYKAGNGIHIGDDGTISAVITDIVSLEPDNVIQEKDGKLYVSPVQVYGNLVSTDDGNIIVKGTDERVFLGKDQLDTAVKESVAAGSIPLVSSDEDNVLTEGADHGVVLKKEELATSVQEQISGGSVKVVSVDAHNIITEGSDKGAFLSETSFTTTVNKVIKAGDVQIVSGDADNVVIEGADKGAYMSKKALGTAIKDGVTSGDVVITSKDRGNVLQQGEDGGVVLSEERLASAMGGIIAEGSLTVVSSDGGNVITPGSDKGAFLSKADFKTAVTEAVQSKSSGIVSGNAGNVLKEGTDGGVNLSKEDFASAMEEAIQGGTVPLVSSDENNLIIEGGDGGAFLDTAAIGSAMEEGLADGSIDLISEDANNAAVLGSDHKVFVEDKWLPLSGGTMTGPLILAGGGDGSNEVVTKSYVDSAIRRSGKGLSIGHFLLWPYKVAPTGFVLANGETVRRDTYSQLWDFINKNSDLLKTEAEWQIEAEKNNGFCAFYSSGDGANTFRLPKFAPYIELSKGNGTSATTYHEAGLPNIEGTAKPHNYLGFFSKPEKTFPSTEGNSWTGAFYDTLDDSNGEAGKNTHNVAGSATYNATSLGFDASRVSDVYGKSDTVQPESMEWNVIIAALTDADDTEGVSLKDLQDTLQRYTQTVDSVLPLGYFFDWPFKTPPAGALHANGEEVRRVTYDALWQYVQRHPEWLKTETEWQKIAAQDNGYCAYYSDGDGTDTFRLPKFAPFRHTVNSLAEAGRYNPDNIGDIDLALRVADDAKQVATKAYQEGARLDDPYGLGATGGWMNGGVTNGTDEGFYKQSLATSDADKAGDLLFPYAHSGEHIIPESSNWITCIIAYAPVSEEKEIKYEELKQTIQEFTQSVDSIVPLGQFFSWPYKEAPAGALVCNGGEYNRALYKDLWAMVQAHPSWMKTDTEWNEIATANGGYCPYYSDGDGAYTFRIPKFAPFVKNSGEPNDAEAYDKKGLVDPTDAFAEMATHTWLRCVVAYNTKPQQGTVDLEELRRLITEAKEVAGNLTARMYNAVEVIEESTETWTPPVTGWAEVTVIGGGGGGGSGKCCGYCTGEGGGGGGAGENKVEAVFLSRETPIAITIGAGGTGGQPAGTSGNPGTNGGESSFIGGNIEIRAEGGGGGGQYWAFIDKEGSDVDKTDSDGLTGTARYGGIGGGRGITQGLGGDRGTGDSMANYNYVLGVPGQGGGSGGLAATRSFEQDWNVVPTQAHDRPGCGGAGGYAQNNSAWAGTNGMAGIVIVKYYDPEKSTGI